jgi:hypothetical protein
VGGLLVLPIAPPVELSLVFVSNYLWVPDEVGALHGFGVIGGIWDEVSGVAPPTAVSPFDGISIGSALIILGDDGMFHRFQLSGPLSEWQDIEQTIAPPANQRAIADVLLPNGLLIQSTVDGLVHLMKVGNGRWADYGVPAAPGGGGGGGHPGHIS